jgi:predicted Co/Zn/Cd cation transporter (cation efflux family)
MVTIYINGYMSRKDKEKFPFGKHILEPMIIALKSLIIGGMCIYSLVGATRDIFNGGNSVEYGFAIIYSVVSVFGCSTVYLFMKKKGNKLSSELINIESSQWLMDTLLSVGVMVGFIIAIILKGTRFSFLNAYIDPAMVLIISVVFLKLPINTFINSFREIICVTANDEINEDIYILVKEIEKEYNFEDSIARVSKVGRELRIEIDFVYNEKSKLKNLDQMDYVREEIYNAMKHIKYNKWLNVSFTGDRKWAI